MLGSNFKYNTSTQDTRQILISVPNMKVGCVLDIPILQCCFIWEMAWDDIPDYGPK